MDVTLQLPVGSVIAMILLALSVSCPQLLQFLDCDGNLATMVGAHTCQPPSKPPRIYVCRGYLDVRLSGTILEYQRRRHLNNGVV